MDLENVNFKVITKEGAKCGFCNKILKPIGLDYLYSNIDQDMIEYERCNCKKAVEFWNEYDAKENQKEKQKRYREIINKIYKDNYMKKRLQKYNFETIDEINVGEEVVKTIKKYTELCVKGEMKNGIIIYGNIGHDNTYLAASIANKIIENNKIVLMERSSSIIYRIKESFNENIVSETEIIELYSNVDMLIIDDLGSENLSKWAIEKLYKIIINRYENELPIIITSRYNKNEILDKLSNENDLEIAEELVQILYRMCYGITISNSNFETKKLA